MRAGYRLTAEAEADRLDFVCEHGQEGNCSCHLSPPCSSCMHPGNPAQQAEDDAAWEPDPEASAIERTEWMTPEQLGQLITQRMDESAAVHLATNRESLAAMLATGTSWAMMGMDFGTEPAQLIVHYTPAWRTWLQEPLEERTAEAIMRIVDGYQG